mgnify:CR=1 FL=1
MIVERTPQKKVLLDDQFLHLPLVPQSCANTHEIASRTQGQLCAPEACQGLLPLNSGEDDEILTTLMG